MGRQNVKKLPFLVKRNRKKIRNVRAADAKEVGVGDPAEETYCHPNKGNLTTQQVLSTSHSGR
jgi:hypothetical protein